MTQHTIIVLPKLGESIVSATVIKWFKQPGEKILKDEPLLEVNTDKIASEIPSPVSGILVEIHAAEGVEIEVGKPLASISAAESIQPLKQQDKPVASQSESSNESFLTPAVLRLLHEKKIPLSDIDKIPHTGLGGRLTKHDVEHYCPLKAQPVQASSDIERIKMNPLRKSIAENMVKSFYQAPHATLMTEVDITDLITLVAKEKQTFLEQHNVKLSITAFVAKAIVDALKEFPLLNSSLENDTILVKKQINLGIAVSVDQGVMVPVIRGAQNLSLEAISKQISLLAEKARSQTLMTKDVQDGSITMTNFGMTGIQIGIPIIRYPEVAIIALGATTKKVAPMPDDTIAIRSVMMVTLTFDHRVLDGLYGCGFLNLLKKNIEENAGLV
jgi:2-oxoglutarate dehydrogenase E2 component (dihydrolipoamide succinyltransferase)